MCEKGVNTKNSKALYEELCVRAVSRMNTEEIKKMYHDIKDQKGHAPFFNLIDELEESDKSLKEKLGIIAHLKAYVANKEAKYTWLWEIISILISLVALMVSTVVLGNTTSLSCLDEVTAILVLIITVMVAVGGSTKVCSYSTDQYILSIVESVEAYYLNQKSDNEVINATEGKYVLHIDKT